jgi:hypothetical protein
MSTASLPFADCSSSARAQSKVHPVDESHNDHHGISFGTNDEWKEAWTSYPTDTRHESVCWPEQWLPEDLGDNVRILSLSYDANVLGAHDHVTEIGNNLIQSLVTRYDSNLLPIIPQSTHPCMLTRVLV